MTITSEQLEFKQGRIGSSQVAAAIGVSPFQTPANLAMVLLGRIRRPEENETMRAGNIMEPAIAELYTNKTGAKIQSCTETFTHPTFDWLIAHPDYFYNGTGEARLVEIKNVCWRQRWRWEDGVPVHVVGQCVLQSMLTGIDRVEVVAYFGGSDLEIYNLIITDKQREALLTKVCLYWFDWIAKGMIPPVTGEDIELIKALYPAHTSEEPVVATEEVMEDIESYRKYKILRMDIDNSIGTLEAKMRLTMSGSSKLVAPDGTLEFTYKQTNPSHKVDWEAVGTEFLCHNEKLYNKAVKKSTWVKEGSRQFHDKYNYDKE